jgi:hypothetical protein
MLNGTVNNHLSKGKAHGERGDIQERRGPAKNCSTRQEHALGGGSD